MTSQLSTKENERLKKHQKEITLVIWVSTLSSLFVVIFLIYVAVSFSRQGASGFLLYAVSTIVGGFSIVSHRRLIGRRNSIRSDLSHGLTEEITGTFKKLHSQGGYILEIHGQHFVVDGLLGRDLPNKGTVRLSYAPHSRLVLSVESL